MASLLTQEEGRSGEAGDVVGHLPRRMPRRSVVRSLSTMHMMGFTPLGFFETVSEGDNLVEGRMSLPTGLLGHSLRMVSTLFVFDMNRPKKNQTKRS